MLGRLTVETVFQDLRYAARTLGKAPAFTATAVLTLAIGMGATTSIFSVVNSVLLRPLPYERPGQLVRVWEAPSRGKRNEVSPGVFLDWKRQSVTFEGLGAFTFVDMNLVGTGDPLRVNGVRMSANGLNILRARPLLGRSFAPGEDQPGQDKVVVLTHRLWQQRFGGDMNVIGRTIRLDEETRTIIGVLPPNFLLWEDPQFVVPYMLDPALANRRDGHWLLLLGRVKPGVTIEQAQADLNAISDRSRTLYPAWKKDWGATVVPMQEQMTGTIKPTLLVLLGAVGCVLLIACANVANLLLARASARQKAIAVRSALGASRWRVIRQLLAESVLLSLLGGLVGLLVAFWSVEALSHLSAVNLPRAQEVALDLRVLGFALFVSLLTGVVFGLAPAALMSKLDLQTTLKEGARGSQGGTRNRLRSGLIVSEVAFALMLLVGVGLLLNSFFRLSRVSPGFNPQQALTMQLSLPGKKYADDARRTAFFAQMVERIEALPGVVAAGLAVSLPIASGAPEVFLKVNGRVGGPQPGYLADFDFCTPDYFRAMGILLIRGRRFEEHDGMSAAGVAIINEALAREYFSNEEPLGQTITVNNRTWEIVGIVGDVRQRGLAESVRPLFYRPQSSGSENWTTGANLVVRTSTPPREMAQSIRQAILAVDPDQPVANVRTMEDVIAASVGQRRFVLMLLGVFAGSALLLAAIGLYGVIAYAVSQRTREIGIRIALGADRSNVLGLVLYQGMKLAAMGILLGVIGALGLTRVLRSLLYEIKPTDPLTFVGVSLILLLVALFASWLPAQRAARVDPMVALRYE
jgi:predicted permease